MAVEADRARAREQQLLASQQEEQAEQAKATAAVELAAQQVEQKAQDEKERREAERQRVRERKLQSLPAEPDKADADTVLVCVRLPCGNKVSRLVNKNCNLQVVIDFIDSHVLVDCQNNPVDRYQLVSHFPRVIYSDFQVPLASLKLGKQVLLFVEENSDAIP